jgi:hypothetical protein
MPAVACRYWRSIKERFASVLDGETLAMILIGVPIMILLGFHLALLAGLAWRYLRVPYFVALVGMFLGMMWALSSPTWICVVTWVLLAAPHLVRSFDELSLKRGFADPWFEGANLEIVTPAHVWFLICQFWVNPAILSAIERAK